MALKINANKIELVPLKDIKLNPKNRNKHSPEQIAQFVKILRYQGNRNPGVISNRSGLLVAGEGRYLAMKEAGETHMPVMFQDFEDEEQEYLYGISDNAIASQAALDLVEIHVDLKDMGPFDLDLLGIRDFQFEPDPETQGDPDAVPEPPKVAKTKRGELWTLGSHRLLIDDCTTKENVERLMAGEKADMVFTDPPYGMNANTDWSQASKTVKASMNKYGGNTVISQKAADNVKAKMPVFGDDQDYDPTPILEAFPSVDEIFLWGGDYFAKHLPQGGSWIVWDKQCWGDEGNKCPLSLAEFELCWSKQKHQRLIAKIKWLGIMAEDTRNRVHPTQKPSKLAEWFFEHWGKDAKNIWDGYLGSGSTLIACEKTNRRCYGMEIEPLYGDVILTRWAKFSGKDPVREDGVKWSELNG